MELYLKPRRMAQKAKEVSMARKSLMQQRELKEKVSRAKALREKVSREKVLREKVSKARLKANARAKVSKRRASKRNALKAKRYPDLQCHQKQQRNQRSQHGSPHF